MYKESGVWMFNEHKSAVRVCAESAMRSIYLDPADFRRRDRIISALGHLVDKFLDEEHETELQRSIKRYSVEGSPVEVQGIVGSVEAVTPEEAVTEMERRWNGRYRAVMVSVGDKELEVTGRCESCSKPLFLTDNYGVDVDGIKVCEKCYKEAS